MSENSKEELERQLENASSYEERASIRKALRELKKSKGDAASKSLASRRGSSGYRRFTGGVGVSGTYVPSQKSFTGSLKSVDEGKTVSSAKREISPSFTLSSQRKIDDRKKDHHSTVIQQTPPDNTPSIQPDETPSTQPDEIPSTQPDQTPSPQPDEIPSTQPDEIPSTQPDQTPSPQPDEIPSPQPDEIPSPQPDETPSPQPDEIPSPQPDETPSPQPDEIPSPQPDETLSPQPDEIPSTQPDETPSTQPDETLSPQPDETPSTQPDETPSTQPDETPSPQPDETPSTQPDETPSTQPDETPSTQPDETPSTQPDETPSTQPDETPSTQPDTKVTKFAKADAREETDFHFRLRSKTEVKKRKPESKHSAPEPKAEFQNFKLRSTPKSAASNHPSPWKHDVPKKWEPEFQKVELKKTASHRPRAATVATSTRPQVHKRDFATPEPKSGEGEGDLSITELESCLNQFVNRVLKYPLGRQKLADLSKEPKVLCELINKSVPGTVDLRALTVIKPGDSRSKQQAAREENMTLAVESARSIGIYVKDETPNLLLGGDPLATREFFMGLVKAKAVHMPAMRDAPEGTFQNPILIFAVFGIKPLSQNTSTDSFTDGPNVMLTHKDDGLNKREDRSYQREEKPYRREDRLRQKEERSHQRVEKPSIREEKVYQRNNGSAITDTKKHVKEETMKAKEGEPKTSEKPTQVLPSGDIDTTALSYEERRQLRKAAREKRQEERAALAAKV